MKTIGELVEETLDYADRGLFENGFLPACYALRQTAENEYQEEDFAEPKFQRYIRENWELIDFMGVMRSDKLPPELPFQVRRAVPSFNTPNLIREIITYAVRQTIATKRIPLEIGFNQFGGIEVKGEKLLFSKTMLFALIGSVVFNPINKDEKISERYWLNIWDFKMFVTELWGRRDLAERVMKLYS